MLLLPARLLFFARFSEEYSVKVVVPCAESPKRSHILLSAVYAVSALLLLQPPTILQGVINNQQFALQARSAPLALSWPPTHSRVMNMDEWACNRCLPCM